MESGYGENVSKHVRLGGPPVDPMAFLLVPATPLPLYHLPGWTLENGPRVLLCDTFQI